MPISGHKTPKTFMDYIMLSSEEIANELKLTNFLNSPLAMTNQIASMSKKEGDMW